VELWNQHPAIGVPVIQVPFEAKYIVVAQPYELMQAAPVTQAVVVAEPAAAATLKP